MQEDIITFICKNSNLQESKIALRIKTNGDTVISISAVIEDDYIESESNSDIIQVIKRQLQEYFYGTRKKFDIKFDTSQGTDFQRRVWQALRDIPYGETRTYGEIAKNVGSPKGARAVGMACNKNPLLIITPCHRVIGSTGSLTGFACGIDIKKLLLDIEN